MGMPDREAYIAAVQNPDHFSLPILRGSTVTRNETTGTPMAFPGAFGIVFQMRTSSNLTRSIKCFTTEHKTRTARYGAICDYLDRLFNRNTASSLSLVQCYYMQKGIRVGSEWFPILMMDWVDGEPLNLHVARLCAQENPGPMLMELAKTWAQLALSLGEDRLTHGDLQHGNIIVLPDGQLKLIDYDGMCVPALEKRFVVEGGHPNYQHPRRTIHHVQELDAFAELVIFTALLVLSVKPALWEKYDCGRNMLFQTSDFHLLRESPLFRELDELEAPLAVSIVSNLKRACTAPSLLDIPAFGASARLLDL